MYTALAIMIAGILAGRLFRARVPARLLARVVFASILFLLFLLGAQIGANDRLFADLPGLGIQALALTLFCVAGSIAAVNFIASRLARRGLSLHGQRDKNAR